MNSHWICKLIGHHFEWLGLRGGYSICGNDIHLTVPGHVGCRRCGRRAESLEQDERLRVLQAIKTILD